MSVNIDSIGDNVALYNRVTNTEPATRIPADTGLGMREVHGHAIQVTSVPGGYMISDRYNLAICHGKTLAEVHRNYREYLRCQSAATLQRREVR